MKKKKKIITYALFLAIILIVVYGYKNYRKNELIKISNSTFNDANSKFILSQHLNREIGREISKTIASIKHETINDFLDNTSERIVFNPKNIDTLVITEDNGVYKYISSLELGDFDLNYNELLVDRIAKVLLKNDINKAEIYTISPTLAGDIPLPPGYLTNVKEEGNGTD